LSIEHIVPQIPRQIEDWMDEKFQDNYLHSIGNLTLDTLSENSSKSNLSFEFKYHYYYQDSSFLCQRELDMFIDFETGKWNRDSIESRGLKIVIFAMNFWDYRNV
jgi:CRISPR/Cas system-associated endonuclease/helicase Cas3